MKKRRKVLISVTDKTDLHIWGGLPQDEWEILSTGGTATALRDQGIPCTLIEEYTGFPEMLGGRLKTLHPKVFGGILAERTSEHLSVIAEHGIDEIDVVVVNLYAFRQSPSVANIDIGGPSLLRAASKNAASVTVVIDPAAYSTIVEQLLNGGVPDAVRAQLALDAFRHTYQYDSAIAAWLGENPKRILQVNGAKH
jgi:phosphoribosylaminoimidazolecarboxamide formyltransferase/IMP cyclohydrolase